MKIGIVNDSPTAMACLSQIVRAEGMTVLWTAVDGAEAVEKCRAEQPDILLMDLVMPRMDGVEATRRIMRDSPCPILIVTASVNRNVSAVFEAMGAGAVDVVATPSLQTPAAGRQLVEKIRVVASLGDLPVSLAAAESARNEERSPDRDAGCCVLIGSSAGGPAALMEILPSLPADLPAAVIIVQHLDERFASELVSWLASRSLLPVRLAAEGEQVKMGEIWVAGGGRHLVFASDHRLHYTDQPLLPYQPSIDVLYDSALRYGPQHLLGVLLTGMGRDGAAGLKRLRAAGHPTIAQDEKTSAIYGMPRVAAEMKAASEILPLAQISHRIISWSHMEDCA